MTIRAWILVLLLFWWCPPVLLLLVAAQVSGDKEKQTKKEEQEAERDEWERNQPPALTLEEAQEEARLLAEKKPSAPWPSASDALPPGWEAWPYSPATRAKLRAMGVEVDYSDLPPRLPGSEELR